MQKLSDLILIFSKDFFSKNSNCVKTINLIKDTYPCFCFTKPESFFIWSNKSKTKNKVETSLLHFILSNWHRMNASVNINSLCELLKLIIDKENNLNIEDQFNKTILFYALKAYENFITYNLRFKSNIIYIRFKSNITYKETEDDKYYLNKQDMLFSIIKSLIKNKSICKGFFFNNRNMTFIEAGKDNPYVKRAKDNTLRKVWFRKKNRVLDYLLMDTRKSRTYAYQKCTPNFFGFKNFEGTKLLINIIKNGFKIDLDFLILIEPGYYNDDGACILFEYLFKKKLTFMIESFNQEIETPENHPVIEEMFDESIEELEYRYEHLLHIYRWSYPRSMTVILNAIGDKINLFVLDFINQTPIECCSETSTADLFRKYLKNKLKKDIKQYDSIVNNNLIKGYLTKYESDLDICTCYKVRLREIKDFESFKMLYELLKEEYPILDQNILSFIIYDEFNNSVYEKLDKICKTFKNENDFYKYIKINSLDNLFINKYTDNSVFVEAWDYLLKKYKILNPGYYNDFFEEWLNKKDKECELKEFKNSLLSENDIKLKPYSINHIDSLSGYDFEIFLKELFIRMNYLVIHTQRSGDQGADLVIQDINSLNKIVVQAKRWKGKISNKGIQEVVAAIKQYNADEAMVITNSYFTKSAAQLANSNNVALIDRDKLNELIQYYLT